MAEKDQHNQRNNQQFPMANPNHGNLPHFAKLKKGERRKRAITRLGIARTSSSAGNIAPNNCQLLLTPSILFERVARCQTWRGKHPSRHFTVTLKVAVWFVGSLQN